MPDGSPPAPALSPPRAPAPRGGPSGDSSPADAPWASAPTTLIERLGTDGAAGLRADEAARRLSAIGSNTLPEPPRPGRAELLWRQLRNPMVGLLAGAAVVSLLVGEALDAGVILAIVLLNAALGFVQEARSDDAAAALRRMLVARARVVRDATAADVDAATIVPGDVVLLRPGDRVPADARLLEAVDAEVDESTLTGESLSVSKDVSAVVAPAAALAERPTMVHAGTTLVRGAARALVVATGPHTAMGALASVTPAAPPTPLQRRLDHLTGLLLRAGLAVLVLCAALAGATGTAPGDSLLLGVSLAVAAIPEGLPAVLTITLALGVRRMAEDGAIVRHLPAVETLGSTTVICSDKTGTLTENRMTVTRTFADDGDEALLAAALVASPDADDPRAAPEEAAIAAAAGGTRADALAGRRITRTLPFSSDRRRVGVVVAEADGTARVYVKGAPEVVLARLATRRPDLEERSARWARDGVRVLVVATRAGVATGEDPESRLEMVGLLGLADPPRADVRGSVDEARGAGVRTIMITGDHPATAAAIARETGILAGPDDVVLTGADLDALDGDELREAVARTSVFARVEPRHKPVLVQALRDEGEIVAMTGDGVNDVAALAAAHVGVAMGRRGTDAAVQAADIVLTDDDYSTIVRAITRGRTIYDNVVHFVQFLLAANLGEVLVFALALAAGLGAPLTILQILVVNLLTDGPPAVALGLDPPSPDVIRRPPRPPRQGIIEPIATRLATGAIATGLAGFASFAIGHADSAASGQTMAFITLVVAQLLYVLAVRGDAPFWRSGPNRLLVLAIIGSAAALVAALAIEPVGRALGAVDLDPGALAIAVLLGLAPLTAAESFKAIRRATSPGRALAP